MWPAFGADGAARRLIHAAAANQADTVTAEEAGAGSTAVAAAARAAAATGATRALAALLARHSVTELSMVAPNTHFLDSEVVSAVTHGQHGHRLLLSQPPVVIAACRLHSEALALLLRAGARLPPTVGDANGTVPLLAYWISRLPNGGNHPAALPILQQLLAAGADPLWCDPSPPTHRPELTTRGRSGTCCSFMLTCTCPALLGAGVQHVLRQCAAESCGRELSRQEVAVLLVAARLAGLQEEAEQLLADATLRPCFRTGALAVARSAPADPHRRPDARLALSPAMRDKRRRLMARRAFGLFMEDGLEEDEWDAEQQWLAWSQEHAWAAAAAASDSETESEDEELIGLDEEEEKPSAAPSVAGATRHLLRTMAQKLAALRRQRAGMPWDGHPGGTDAPSTSAAAAAGGAAAPAGSADGASTSATTAAQQPSTSAAAAGPSHHASPAGRRPCRHLSGPVGSPQRAMSAGRGGGSERLLLAQLVADCASYNLLDVLHLLLSQGGSPNQPVPWVHPTDLSPAALAAREAHEHMHVPGGERSPLALAAAAGHAEAVAALRRRGAHLDLASLRHAVWSFSPEGVDVLLGCVPRSLLPPSPASSFAESSLNCPILLLLQRHQELAARVMAEAAAAVVPQHAPHYRVVLVMTVRAQMGTAPDNWPPSSYGDEAQVLSRAQARAAGELARLEAQALRMMDALYEAGFRIRVFKDHCGMCADGIWRMGRVEGLQPRELAQLDVQGRNRRVWQTYCRAAWSPASHATFPPAFRAAAKTLLLAARYGRERQLLGRGLCGKLSEEDSEEECGAPCKESSQASGVSGSTVVATAVGGDSPCVFLDANSCAGAVAAAGLALLPQELVFKIISEAAYPLSAWVRG